MARGKISFRFIALAAPPMAVGLLLLITLANLPPLQRLQLGLEDVLWKPSPRLTYLGCLALIAIVACVTALRSRRAGALLAAGSIGLTALASWGLASLAGALVPAVPLALASLLGYGVGHVGSLLVGRRERRRPQNVVKVTAEISAADSAGASGGGASRDVTVCFIDVEDLPAVAADLVQRGRSQYLSAYFSGVSSILRHQGGLLSEDLSLGVVGLFGVDQAGRADDQATRACQAALALQRTMAQMAEDWQQELGLAFRCRIGVHTSRVEIQTRREQGRLQHTIAGPEVYLAVRIARCSTRFGAAVLASAETARRLEPAILTERVGEIVMRDRQEPLGMHRVLREVAEAATIAPDRTTARALART